MKKLKFMLLSLALFAVVGAALAFKARFTHDYCVTATTGTSCNITGLTCPTKSLAVDETGTSKFCTIAYDNNNCNNQNGVACQSTTAPKVLQGE